MHDAVALAAGSYAWWFNGRAADGTMLPRGRYTSSVTATDGTLTATQTVAFTVDAFTIKPSDATPGRGQTIKVSVTSAEKLVRAPVLHIKQPGLKDWYVRMTRTGTYTYTATIRMKSTGRAGAGRAAGPRGGHRRRGPVDDDGLPAPLNPARGPHRSAPDHPVLSLTGTIVP